MNIRVNVTLKEGVLDPQGNVILEALKGVELHPIREVRQGKIFDLVIDVPSSQEAESLARQACDLLLVNAVIEDYSVESL